MDDKLLVEILKLAQDKVFSHRQTLWEEEKHFSWWISIIFTALIFAYTINGIGDQQKLAIIIIGTVFGVFVSIFAFRIIRKEGEFFKVAQAEFNATALALNLNALQENPANPDEHVRLMPKYPVFEDPDEVIEIANKTIKKLVFGIFRPWSLGVRDLFQLIYIIAIIVFISFGIFTWVTLH